MVAEGDDPRARRPSTTTIHAQIAIGRGAPVCAECRIASADCRQTIMQCATDWAVRSSAILCVFQSHIVVPLRHRVSVTICAIAPSPNFGFLFADRSGGPLRGSRRRGDAGACGPSPAAQNLVPSWCLPSKPGHTSRHEREAAGRAAGQRTSLPRAGSGTGATGPDRRAKTP